VDPQYLFHVCRNHPFIDGNKRASLAAALTFLWLNRMRFKASEDELTELVMGVAAGRIGKPEVAVLLTQRTRRRGR
jgi:death-on-curing protein